MRRGLLLAALPASALLAVAPPRVSPAPESAPELLRGPYLEAVERGSAWVCWRADREAEARVEYEPLVAPPRGPDAPGGPARTVAAGPSAGSCAELSGLLPSTRYRYRLGLAFPGTSPPEWGPWLAFRSAEGPEAELDFAVFGDSGKGNEAQRRVAELLARDPPGFILHVGDVVYDYGRDAAYDERYFRPYRALLGGVPVYFAVGNHDYGNFRLSAWIGRKWLRANFLSIHRLPGRGAAGAADRPTYYSFDRGPAHFVALDTNGLFPIRAAPALEPGSPQLRWLEEDLVASTAAWKLVFMHVPAYSTGKHGSNPELIRWLCPVLERGGVDVVFQGHDHDYERTFPVRDGRRAEGGVTYVTAGIGGGKLSGRYGEAPWSAIFARRHGAVRVRIEGRRLRLEAVADDGTAFDRWEKAK